MEQTYGQRLQIARKRAGYKTQQALGDRIGFRARTVRYWEADAHQPDAATKELLREVLGNFDAEGDPVEVAIRQSELVKWRQDAVITEYGRQRYEQRRERGTA